MGGEVVVVEDVDSNNTAKTSGGFGLDCKNIKRKIQTLEENITNFIVNKSSVADKRRAWTK